MEIYLINTGRKYALYYNPPKEKPKAAGIKIDNIDLCSRIENADGARLGLTTREFRISTDLDNMSLEAYRDIKAGANEKLRKIGEKIRTKVSGILRDAAHAGAASLNYSDSLPENIARRFFLRIVKKEKIKSYIILGASIAFYGASYVPLAFVGEQPVLGPIVGATPVWPIVGPIVIYQIAVLRTLRKGIRNISFVPSPEVSKLERIISGEKGLELANPDLIEYRTAKGL